MAICTTGVPSLPSAQPGRIRPSSAGQISYLAAPPFATNSAATRFVAPSPPPKQSAGRSGAFTRSFFEPSHGSIVRLEGSSMARATLELESQRDSRALAHQQRIWQTRWADRQMKQLAREGTSPRTPQRPISADRQRRVYSPAELNVRPATAERGARRPGLSNRRSLVLNDGLGPAAPPHSPHQRGSLRSLRSSPSRRQPVAKQLTNARAHAFLRARAARTIQARWRQVAGRRAQQLRGAREFHLVAQLARARFLRAARTIQRAQRASRRRKRAKAESRPQPRGLALQTETLARWGVQVVAADVVRHLAARRIQTRFRLGRELLSTQERALLSANEHYFERMRLRLETDSATTIQCFARGFLARAGVLSFERAIRLKAAVSIQKRLRGRLALARVRMLALTRTRIAARRRSAVERGFERVTISRASQLRPTLAISSPSGTAARTIHVSPPRSPRSSRQPGGTASDLGVGGEAAGTRGLD